MLSFHLLDKSLTYLTELYDAQKRSYLASLNEPGSGSFTINAYSALATAVNLTLGNLVRVDWSGTTVGWWMIEDISETLIADSKSNETISVSGRGLLGLLQKAVIYPLLWPAEFTRLETPLVCAPNAGAGFMALANSNIELPFVVSFDTDSDSDDNLWVDDVYLEFRPGQNLLDVINALAGLGYYVRISGVRTLDIYKAFGGGLFGQDRTATVIFRRGLNILTASRKTAGRELANVVLGQGQSHWVESQDATSITAHNRRQMFLQARHAANEAQVIAANTALLARTAEPGAELAIDVTMTPAAFTAYNLGDLVRVIIPGKLDDTYRIYSIQLNQRSTPADVPVTLGVNRETVLPAAQLQDTINARSSTASAAAYRIQAADARTGAGGPQRFDWYISGTLSAGDAQGAIHVVTQRMNLESFNCNVKTAPGSAATINVQYSEDAGANWYELFTIKPTVPASATTGTGGTFGGRVLNINTWLRLNVDNAGSAAAANLSATLSGVRV